MSKINFHKVVAALPSELEANSVYYVRVGTGFDQYITNSTGTIAAYSPNVKLPTATEVTISDAEGYFDGNNVEEALQQLAEGMTPAEIKSAYESNANTNAFTDAEKSKLAGIASGATKNDTDAQLRDRATHTGVQPIASVEGLQDALDDKVDNADPRMTDSREWTASVVPQAEAEAGTATTARKWTAQRVRQAILGWWNASTFKTKLDGIESGATKNATDEQLRDRATHTGVQPISSVDGLQSAIDSKVDSDDARLTNAREWTASLVSQAEAEAGTATTTRKWTAQRVRQAILGWWNSSAEKTKLDGIATGATKNATDAQLRDRSTHTGTQAIGTVSGLQTALDAKVDKVTGMGLSQENFTTAEKNKLASLESSKFKGQFSSFAALQSAFPTADVGSYAYVDQGAGQDVVKYIWDSSDTKWVLQQGESAALTPSDVKNLYESNADTNAFTNSEKSKLAGIESGAQVNVGTNLAMGGSGNSRTITSSTGNNVSVPVATTSAAGFMSTTDKTKLDGLSNVNLTAGSNISLSGAYPNITISSTNTTYSEISEAEVTAGTASTERAISARRLKFAVDTHGLKIGTTSTTAKAGDWTPSAAEIPNLDAGKITTGVFAAARIPTLNQNTTGNAATATKLATARTINGVAFDGTENITIAGGWTETTTSVNKTLAVRERCLVTAAGRTITLPASPTRGDEVVICVGAFENTTIGRNGQTILGKADNAVINREWSTVHLFFDGNTWRFA